MFCGSISCVALPALGCLPQVLTAVPKGGARLATKVNSEAVDDLEGAERGEEGLRMGIRESNVGGCSLNTVSSTLKLRCKESLYTLGRHRTRHQARQRPLIIPAKALPLCSSAHYYLLSRFLLVPLPRQQRLAALGFSALLLLRAYQPRRLIDKASTM